MLKIFDLKKRNNRFNLVLTGVILFIVIWRFYGISIFHQGLSANELNLLGQAEDLAKNWGIQGKEITYSLYLYGLAFFGKLVSFNIIFLRSVQASLSIVTIIFFYFFTRNWFNRRVALFATLFLSANAFYLALSRNIEPIILVPLFVILIVYLYTLAFKKEGFLMFVASGIVSGLALYADIIFFVLPLVFVMTFYYFYRKDEKFMEKFRNKILLSLLCFIIVAIPYLYFLPQTAGEIIKTYNPGSVGGLFLSMGTLISSLLYHSPINRLYYIGTQPLLSPFIAVTFLCGLVYAFFHIERRKYYFLVLTFVALLFLVSLGWNEAPRNYLTLFPVIFIFSATIFEYILSTWFKTFPFNRMARFLFTFILSFFIFLTIYYNYQKYFEAWSNNKEVQQIYSHQFTDLHK